MSALGNPVWLDFGSNDFAASKAFYTDYFGWSFKDSGEASGHYTMISHGSTLVAGGMDTSSMTCPEGGAIPSNWDVYLSVDDVDATLETAIASGAQVIVPAADAGSAGRFAVVLDPTGTSVGLWKGADTKGFEFTGEPGTPLWFELMTQDYDKAVEFYQSVFCFTPVGMHEPMDDEWRYATNGPAEQARYGIGDAAGIIPAELGSYWRIYFGVDKADEAATRATELGGKVLDGPVDSPFGRIATIEDPQGATFQICAPSQAVPEGRSTEGKNS